MADKAGKAAKLMNAVTTGPTMSMLDKLHQQMPSSTAVSSPFAALEAERALRADCLAATCPPTMLGHWPLLADLYQPLKDYETISKLNSKVYSLLEGWKQPFDSWTSINRMTQAAYSDYSQQLQEFFKPVDMARFLGMSESIFKAHTAAMQAVTGYADSHAAQLTQIKDFASSFKVSDITALTEGLFPKTVADYLQANPLTKSEWEEAARETYTDDATQNLVEIADVLDAPEQNRLQIIRCLWSIIFLSLLVAGGQTMATDAQSFAARTLWNFISGISLLWASVLAPTALQQWKSGSGYPPPLAKVIASDGSAVPVRKTGNPNSAILYRLPVGALIPLAKEGTKKMKAVAIDINDDGEPIEIAWISRRNLKRIKEKQAYALKKALPPCATRHGSA